MCVVISMRFYSGSALSVACEAVYDEWTDLIQRNAWQGTRYKMQCVGMELVMVDYIEPMVQR